MAKFQIFRDEAGEYGWRLHTDKNNVIAYSAEGYARKLDCQRRIELASFVSSDQVAAN